MRTVAPPRPPPARDALALHLGRYLSTGDERAIEYVVAETRPRLLAAARRIGNPSDAEDAVQAAYLSLVRKRGGSLDAPVTAWLLTAVVRSAYRRKATEKRQHDLVSRLATPPADSAPEPTDGADARDLARIREAVGSLPDRYRDPVVLHHLHGLSIGEVARLLDVPDATVRVRLHRARLLVKSRLSPALASALLALPWLLADLGRDATAGGIALVSGGIVKSNLIVALAVVALVAVGGGAYLVGKSRAPDSTSVADERARRADAEVALARAKEELAAERRAREEARTVPALAPAPAAPRPVEAPAAAPTSPPAADATPGGSRTSGPRIAVGEAMGAVLEKVDLAEIGKHLHAEAPLIGRFAREFAAGKKISEMADLIGEVQAHNGPLVTVALKADEVLKRGNPNTAYTHPPLFANLMAAALEAAGLPLSDAQTEAVADAAKASVEEEARRARARGENAYALEQVIDESEAREQFVAAAYAILTADQRNALAAEDVRGRMQADLYSSALMWIGRAGPLPFSDRNALVAVAEAQAMSLFGLTEEHRAAVHDAVVEWANATPREVIEAPADPLSEKGFLPVSRVLDAAKRQVALARRVVELARLEGEKAKSIAAKQQVGVPVHQPVAAPR